MEKKELINKAKLLLLKGIEIILFIIIFLCSFTILIMHASVPFFPILFLFDIYFFYGQRKIVTTILNKSWRDCIKGEVNWIKYAALPSLAVESFVILYYHEVSFPILEEIIAAYKKTYIG